MSTEPEEAPIRLLVGLGNPGKKYEGTRHNVGFMAINRMAESISERWVVEKKWECRVARSGDLTLIKPETFMNLSGRSVAKVAKFFKIEPAEILVVHDDVALPLGKIRFRATGSAGGHNGIKSMIASLGTQDFPRLKFGIGQPDDGPELSDFVLGKFGKGEAEILEKSLQESVLALECALASGLSAAMNRFNVSPKPPRKPKVKNPVRPPVQPAQTVGDGDSAGPTTNEK